MQISYKNTYKMQVGSEEYELTIILAIKNGNAFGKYFLYKTCIYNTDTWIGR